MSEEVHSFARRLWNGLVTSWPLIAASGLTGAFGWWTYSLATVRIQNEGGLVTTRWEQFRSGAPNTMGDTLAGFIGSLTLIWVVASVIQQSMELRAQRREFSEMVKAQAAQVRALEAQAAIFEDERARSLFEVNGALVEELLSTINYCLEELDAHQLTWFFPEYVCPQPKGRSSRGRRASGKSLKPFSTYDPALDREKRIRKVVNNVIHAMNSIVQLLDEDCRLVAPTKHPAIQIAKERADKIGLLVGAVSPAVRERIENSSVAYLSSVFGILLESDCYWGVKESLTQ